MIAINEKGDFKKGQKVQHDLLLRGILCARVHLFTCANTASCADTCVQCPEPRALLGD